MRKTIGLSDISMLRLRNQQVSEKKFKTVKDLVGFMGAIQAQDYVSAKWAVGARLSDATEDMVEEALNKGEILRTHILRPTWHFISADDIYWMLELTAPHIRASIHSRDRQLGLTEVIFRRSSLVIQKALNNGGCLTRREIALVLAEAKLPHDSSRVTHIMYYAELSGLVCSGPMRGKEQTYMLLAERVPNKKTIPRDEALRKLAQRYFTSHGPATLRDFAWWSGLPMKDVRIAVAMLEKDIFSERVGGEIYCYMKKPLLVRTKEKVVHLLPAFDEFIISYRDRSPSISMDGHQKTVSTNGIFRPIIVVDGQVIGIWKRTKKKKSIVIEMYFFQPPNKTIVTRIKKEAVQYGEFLGLEVQVVEKCT